MSLIITVEDCTSVLMVCRVMHNRLNNDHPSQWGGATTCVSTNSEKIPRNTTILLYVYTFPDVAFLLIFVKDFFS